VQQEPLATWKSSKQQILWSRDMNLQHF
jgi:hypothetical protein